MNRFLGAASLVWIASACRAPAPAEPPIPAPTGQATPAPAEPRSAREAAAPRVPGSLDLERVFELSAKLRLSEASFGGWSDAGHEHFATEGTGDARKLVLVDAATGATRPFHDAARMETALASLPDLDPGTAKEMASRTEFVRSRNGRTAVFNEANDLFVYHFDTGRAVRLTNDAAEEVGEALSPDGAWVSFVRGSNLFAVSTQGGESRQLTTGGDEDHLYGRLDWVYQEEVYGRGNFQANWWSPDSERLAFLALDETDVPKHTIVDSRERHPEVEVWRYPKAGDPNPKARLGVVDVRGGKPRFFDLGEYPADVLIVRVGWSPDSREVLAQLQDRVQTWLDLVGGDPATGKLRKLFRDSSAAWTEPSDGPYWLPGDGEFLWLSERDGYRHLYLYARDGRLVRQLTRGPWEVDSVHLVDGPARRVWFTGDRADVQGGQLFRLEVDSGELHQVTREPGTHVVDVAPDGAFFVDTFSSRKSPPVRRLHSSDGKSLRELARVDGALFSSLGLSAPEPHQPKTRDGFAMEAMLYKPVDFDPSRKYPLLCHTYSGPHAPQVRDVFSNLNGLFHQMLAQEGYLVWVCDNRSASGKGLASASASYRRFGVGELADLEDGLDYLIAKGFVDEARIGIWGWSYGGYMSAYALTHSKRFKLGIAGAPVTDWRLYDSIYTERYMGLPAENQAGYDAGSVLAAAADLSGRLLLICGEIDENVHAQNSLQLAAALQKAGKQFDLMVYPGNRHGIVEPDQKKHLYAMMAEYVRTRL